MQAHISGSLRYEGLVGSSLGPYRLEQALEADELGAVFLARGTDSRTYRLRLLPMSGEMSPQQRSHYLDAAQAQLMALANLQHPHILPLKDYGQWRGVPYLVYPYAPLRSVSALLAQNGPPDLQTLGRYLDQIASALEHLHEHGIVHGQLTTDHIYLQMDGQTLVADAGVRRLIEMSGQAGATDPVRFGVETLAPELSLGRQADTRTDVYDLGAVLYRLLTAEPVFHGAGSNEITELSLRATPPRPSARRTGIPVEMDGLIAATLAKDPNRRPGQPGTVANAYAEIVSPNDASRTPFNPTSGPAYRPPMRTATRETSAPSAPFRAQTPAANYSPAGGALVGASFTVRPPRRPGRILLVGLLALGLVATAGLAAFVYLGGAASGQPTALATFSEANDGRTGLTNALQITAEHLPGPAAGTEYDAWLIDTESENVLPLGALTRDGDKYTVQFAGTVNLVAAGNILEITQEKPGVSVPVGTVIARGAWPDKALVHLRHVLTAFPSTPGKTALIAGVVTQSKLLDDHAKALQTAAGHDQAAMLCETQAMLNLLEGQQGPEYHALTSACAARVAAGQGDGYGLLGPAQASGTEANGGYLPGALSHTSLATTVPDASTETKTHAQLVEAALGNIQTWDTILQRDLIGLQKAPSDTTKVAEIVTLAGDAYTGVDANKNGTIEPVEGEGGAVTAYQQAQLMATLTLSPVK
jgi:hypothetical protein